MTRTPTHDVIPTETLLEALAECGMAPPPFVEIKTGEFTRYDSPHGRRGNRACWVICFADGDGGVFGDWLDYSRFTWLRGGVGRIMSAQQREQFHRQMEAAKRREAQERAAAYGAAAQRARHQWGKAACATHPYLTKKAIRPHGTKVTRGTLLVPVYDGEGSFQSLQFIYRDGAKRFLKGGKTFGGRFWLGVPGATIVIAEGFATAAAIHEATGMPVCVAFNAGNLIVVAKDLRAKHPQARIVVAGDDDIREGRPNIGREKAMEAAQAVGSKAVFPNMGKKADFWDLRHEQGDTALLAAFFEPKVTHPLARFVKIDQAPNAPCWTLPGFVADGVVVIAGDRAIGKTSLLVPLAAAVAGLHEPDYALAPKHWRHVIYVTEDLAQIMRILSGLSDNLGLDFDTVKDRFHLVEAARLPAEDLVQVGAFYDQQFSRTVQGVRVPPLVVLDTVAATIDLDNENDNSQISTAVAALKQRFARLPVWLIGHTAKAVYGRADSAVTTRGGGAWEGDANQVLYVVRESEAHDATRWLVRGKTRFEGRWRELQLHSYMQEVQATDQWGDTEWMTLRWSIARPAESTRAEIQQQSREAEQAAAKVSQRTAILDAVEQMWNAGTPLNRTGLRGVVSGKAQVISARTDQLITEGWLHEITVPAAERTNPRKTAFLIRLNASERDEFLRSGLLPTAKTIIPDSWKKTGSRSFPPGEQIMQESPRIDPRSSSVPVGSQTDGSPKDKQVGTNGNGLDSPIPLSVGSERLGTNGNRRDPTGANEPDDLVEVEI